MYKFPYTGLGQQVDLEVKLLSNELSEDGGQLPLALWVGKGDFFEAAKQANVKNNPASSRSNHSSTVIINGDPFDIQGEYVSGEIKVNGGVHRIKSFKRRRNPDGSVHHVFFEVE